MLRTASEANHWAACAQNGYGKPVVSGGPRLLSFFKFFGEFSQIELTGSPTFLRSKNWAQGLAQAAAEPASGWESDFASGEEVVAVPASSSEFFGEFFGSSALEA